MPDNTEKLPPEQELREKLKELRRLLSSAKRFLKDVEGTHTRYIQLKDALNDKENGARANLAWVKEQKKQIADTLKAADTALTNLQKVAGSVDSQITEMNEKYQAFQTISTQVFSEETGLEALQKAAQALKDKISTYESDANSKLTTAQEHLDDIAKKSSSMTTAFDEFTATKAKIDDKETGLEALLREATEYTDSILQTKTTAESELLSITKFNEESGELVEEIKGSRQTVENYEKESETLTDDIRATLNKTASYSLSKALRDRTRGLTWLLVFWGLVSLLAIALLIIGVAIIFYALFLHEANTSAEVAARLKDGPTLTSVVSKVLFTTPLVYAVYFTTSNFGHVRDLRDKYAWKETVAKNLQTYVKTLKEEFPDDKYEGARFSFTIKTVNGIYSEPHPAPKKKKYNFGINKVFQIGLEEEDMKDFKDIIEEGVEEIVTDKVNESKKEQDTDSEPSSDQSTTPAPKKDKQ